MSVYLKVPASNLFSLTYFMHPFCWKWKGQWTENAIVRDASPAWLLGGKLLIYNGLRSLHSALAIQRPRYLHI